MLAFDSVASDPKNTVNIMLKNLLFYSHQNFLVVILVMLSRIPKQKALKNKWAVILKSTIDSKRMSSTKMKNKAEAI